MKRMLQAHLNRLMRSPSDCSAGAPGSVVTKIRNTMFVCWLQIISTKTPKTYTKLMHDCDLPGQADEVAEGLQRRPGPRQRRKAEAECHLCGCQVAAGDPLEVWRAHQLLQLRHGNREFELEESRTWHES